MAKKRKVMLFLVEGKSEREALEILISNIIKNELVVFQVMEGDITSDKNSTPQNINIIHLMDIDGAYIKDENNDFL